MVAAAVASHGPRRLLAHSSAAVVLKRKLTCSGGTCVPKVRSSMSRLPRAADLTEGLCHARPPSSNISLTLNCGVLPSCCVFSVSCKERGLGLVRLGLGFVIAGLGSECRRGFERRTRCERARQNPDCNRPPPCRALEFCGPERPAGPPPWQSSVLYGTSSPEPGQEAAWAAAAAKSSEEYLLGRLGHEIS